MLHKIIIKGTSKSDYMHNFNKNDLKIITTAKETANEFSYYFVIVGYNVAKEIVKVTDDANENMKTNDLITTLKIDSSLYKYTFKKTDLSLVRVSAGFTKMVAPNRYTETLLKSMRKTPVQDD